MNKMQHAQDAIEHEDFLSGGGEMGAVMRAHDWTSTPMGPPQTWPQALRTVVRLLLNTKHPMYIFWGEEGSCIYNDAYAQSIGPERHPVSLGKPAREVWDEIWPIIGPQVEQVMSGGGPTWNVNHLVPITRHGKRDDVYWTYSYSPIDNPEAPLGIGGVLVVCTETTEAVMARQRQEFRIELEQSLRLHHSFENLIAAVAKLLSEHLDVEQCGYGELDTGITHLTIERDWYHGSTDALAGRHRLAGFGQEIAKAIRRGEVVRIDDTLKDPRTQRFLDAFVAIGDVRSCMNVPLEQNNKISALFFVHDTKPRKWSDEEVDLIRMVADHFWLALAQVRSETALRASQRELSTLMASLEQQVEERTAELRATQARQRTIFETSYLYQGLMDLDGTVLDVNASTLNGIGVTQEEFLGKRIWETQWFSGTPGMSKLIEADVAQVAEGGKARREIQVTLPTGRRWFDFSMRPMFGDRGKITGIISEAVETTKRHAAEEQLRHVQKMEALGKLTGGVAHDFNNLLQIVGGNLQLLAKELGDNKIARERLEHATSGVARGAKLVSQLLAFGRRQPLAPRTVNLGDFINEMKNMFQQVLGDGIETVIQVSDDLWNVEVDLAQAENALLNLAVNAHDAMDGHGRLVVEIGNAVLDDADVSRHPGLQPGEFVLLSLTDSGSGMPAAVIEQAFEPFFTTKPIGKGTGLGLSMVWGVVKQLGGHVAIESKVGEGTTVRLYFPRSRHEAQPVAEFDGTTPIRGDESVLVVEDDDEVRDIINGMLANLGYRTVWARNGEEALPILEQNPSIDLLISDVIMPGSLRGEDLATKARNLIPGIAVLFVSGYSRDALGENNRLKEGVHLLEKPFTQDQLANRVREVLDHGSKPAQAVQTGKDPMRVLIVEDDKLVRTLTVEMVSELGYAVSEASGVQEALDALKQGNIDVLLTDLGLRDGKGDDLARQACAYLSGNRILFATGQDSLGKSAAHPELADAYFLRKPFDDLELAQALEQVCR